MKLPEENVEEMEGWRRRKRGIWVRGERPQVVRRRRRKRGCGRKTGGGEAAGEKEGDGGRGERQEVVWWKGDGGG